MGKNAAENAAAATAVAPADIAAFRDIIDARSAAEFAAAHIPGAKNMPALTDAERADIGALHKQDAFSARRAGAAAIAANIACHLRAELADKPPDWAPLVYCARGGQRSGAVVEIMRRIGWRAAQLDGGYKAYRRYVLARLDALPRRFAWRILAGKTGAGKTRILAELRRRGAAVLDLEALARHRGSVFGGEESTGKAQPSQRQFESLLENALSSILANFPPGVPVFAEAESIRIGALRQPAALAAALRAARPLLVEADINLRAEYVAAEYRAFCEDGAAFARTLEKIRRYAGAEKITRWRGLHAAGQWTALAADLLENFYDIGYNKSIAKNYPAVLQNPPVQVNPNDKKSLSAAAEKILALSRS